MISDEDFLQLSALQHFVFCPRQCALIHIEQIWNENIFTAEGRIMHDNAHEEKIETQKGVRVEKGLPLRSKILGLNGKADVVEFHKSEDGKSWIPFPVEYKRGKPKPDDSDKVQLCAQAICLEEMMGVKVERGSLYYGKTRHRFDVEFDESLRKNTEEYCVCLHTLIKSGKTPPPEYSKRCESCSLIGVCMPKTMEQMESVESYIQKSLKE